MLVILCITLFYNLVSHPFMGLLDCARDARVSHYDLDLFWLERVFMLVVIFHRELLVGESIRFGDRSFAND